MPSMQKFICFGYLGQDPELIQNDTGVRFSIATNRRDKDGEKAVDWHQCVAWGKTKDFFLERNPGKGDLVYVEGSLRTRIFEKDGQTHYRTGVVAFRAMSLERAPQSADDAAPAREVEDDDVPF